MVWTTGRINELDIGRKLRVLEVCFWRDGYLLPFVLHDHFDRRQRLLIRRIGKVPWIQAPQKKIEEGRIKNAHYTSWR